MTIFDHLMVINGDQGVGFLGWVDSNYWITYCTLTLTTAPTISLAGVEYSGNVLHSTNDCDDSFGISGNILLDNFIGISKSTQHVQGSADLI